MESPTAGMSAEVRAIIRRATDHFRREAERLEAIENKPSERDPV
jgi:hypothetical protein